jgi:hypothetical protein
MPDNINWTMVAKTRMEYKRRAIAFPAPPEEEKEKGNQ